MLKKKYHGGGDDEEEDGDRWGVTNHNLSTKRIISAFYFHAFELMAMSNVNIGKTNDIEVRTAQTSARL